MHREVGIIPILCLSESGGVVAGGLGDEVVAQLRSVCEGAPLPA